MKKNSFSLVFMIFFCFYFINIQAQVDECGVEPLTAAEKDSIIQNPISTPVASGITFNVPIEIVVIRDDNGTLPQGFAEDMLFDNIVQVNEWYFDHGIQFYVCGISYVNDSRYYDFYPRQVDDDGPGFTEDASVLQLYPVSEAIPIYICNIVRGLGGGEAAGLASRVPVPGILSTGYIGLGRNGLQRPQTIAHEIGHYLGLHHTFLIGNGEQLEPPSTPNCATTGDLICDTPVDPNNPRCPENQVTCTTSGCTRTAGDGMSYSYTPDIQNLMSYYSDACRSRFSIMQGEVMRSILTTHPSRDFLVDATPPSCTDYIASSGIMYRVNKDAFDNFLLFPFENSKVDINNLTLSSSCQETANSSGNYTLDFCVPVPGYVDANLKPLTEDYRCRK